MIGKMIAQGALATILVAGAAALYAATAADSAGAETTAPTASGNSYLAMPPTERGHRVGEGSGGVSGNGYRQPTARGSSHHDDDDDDDEHRRRPWLGGLLDGGRQAMGAHR